MRSEFAAQRSRMRSECASCSTGATNRSGVRLPSMSMRGIEPPIIREETMARIDRRKFLRSSGGGLAGILASGRAPAFAQTTTLHWLRLGDFVPASDTLLRRELVPEAEKALGLKITLETINGNDLQARITSSIQSGSGADLIHAMHNWPQLYAESLVDVSDVAEEIAKQQGGYYDIFASVAKDRKS